MIWLFVAGFVALVAVLFGAVGPPGSQPRIAAPARTGAPAAGAPPAAAAAKPEAAAAQTTAAPPAPQAGAAPAATAPAKAAPAEETAPAAPAAAPAQPAGAAAGAGGTAGQEESPAAKAQAFRPPARLPEGRFGEVVALGERIFVHTQDAAKDYVGNGLTCANCHLDRGRLANSAPMWAAYVLYPQYRSKNDKVNTMQERIEGCFQFSMNGTPPRPESEPMVALVSYFHWLATGAPVGTKMQGQGYPVLPKPERGPDRERGRELFARNCALCHGDDGQGRKAGDRYVFPPLWGPDSYNWGAGMHRIPTAAGFIKANMPLGRGGTLTDQEAWDVAAFVNGHPRPQDPRFTGDLAETRRLFHEDDDFYGHEVDGVLMGSPESIPER